MHGMVHARLVVVGRGLVESQALLQRTASMVLVGRDLVPGYPRNPAGCQPRPGTWRA
jgi:hypothetical protein